MGKYAKEVASIPKKLKIFQRKIILAKKYINAFPLKIRAEQLLKKTKGTWAIFPNLCQERVTLQITIKDSFLTGCDEIKKPSIFFFFTALPWN